MVSTAVVYEEYDHNRHYTFYLPADYYQVPFGGQYCFVRLVYSLNISVTMEVVCTSTCISQSLPTWAVGKMRNAESKMWNRKCGRVGLKIEIHEIHQNLRNPVSMNRPIVSVTCF